MTLNGRKGRILQAIVNEYVETAEPIGSEWLATRYDFGCKSATLRNEMAEMADQGYLVQPHTSAGRIPSTLGYRYYVDCLMPLSDPAGLGDQAVLTENDARRLEIEEIVQATARLLADMTQYPSLATPPPVNTTSLHRLYISPASPHHILVVLLLSTGHVQHRLMEVFRPPTEAAMQRTVNFLNSVLAGRELCEIGRSVLGELPAELMTDRPLIDLVHANIVEVARALDEERLYLEGTSHILRQREFQDVLRLEQLLSALEQRSVLADLFDRVATTDGVTVVIGPESHVEAIQDCSLVTSRYWIRERSGGIIGVVGPTRMHYDRAVAAVGLMARTLSMVLSRSSLG